MFNPITKMLMAKEYSFLRGNALLYAIGGICAIAVNLIPGQPASFVSSILIITVFMVFYCHIAMKSVITEKKEKNDLFLMTLPVSARQLFFSKMGVNWSLFVALWLLFIGAISIIVVTSDRIPSMVLSLYLLIFALLIPAYSIILSVGMVMVSEGWAILAVVICNVLSTVAINMMSNSSGVADAFDRGTFGEIGFVFPAWAMTFLISMCIITTLAVLWAVIAGFRRKEFF